MKHWYCIYTKPKQEDVVCGKLTKFQDIELFNPKLKVKKYVRSRLTERVEELFPSYIFARFDPYQYFHMIKYTRGVRRFVGDRSDMPYIVDASIIDFIKSRMVNGYVYVEPPRLQEGEKVVIVNGPLSGLSGLFLSETKPSERVMVLLNTIQYQAKVEIEKEFIAKASTGN